jgi:conjugal transfer pilus assembly protein TraW
VSLRRWVLSVAAALPTVASASVTLGPTFPIAEPDTLEEIRRQASARDWRQWMQREPVEYGAFTSATLPHAKRDRVRAFDPTYTMPQDVTDETGKVFVAKGTRVNVYERLRMRGRMIVVGATDAHFKWLDDVARPTRDDKVLVANGNVLSERRSRKRDLYILDARFIERFGLQVVPSIVEQDGLQLRVSEYAVGP